jgi:hypothetical protein
MQREIMHDAAKGISPHVLMRTSWIFIFTMRQRKRKSPATGAGDRWNFVGEDYCRYC